MKTIDQPKLLESYINKHRLTEILPKSVISHLQIQRFEAGETILRTDEEMTYYYYFVSGKLKIYSILENGKSYSLRFYDGFDTLGDIEILGDGIVSCNVMAIKSSDFLVIPMDIIRSLCTDYPPFLQSVIKSLSDKLRSSSSNSSYNLLYPLINRLASFLSEHVTTGDTVVLKSSLQDIAELLGTSYRHLARTFNEMESMGIIKRDRKTIQILDQETLVTMSKELYK